MSEPDTDVLSDFSAAAGKFVPRARKLLSSAMISAAMLQSPGLAPEASAAMQRRLTERLRDIESLLSDLSVLSSLKSDPADRVSFTEIVRSAVRGADALPLHIADIKAEIPEDEIFVRSPRTALSASVMSLIRNAAEAHATEIRISPPQIAWLQLSWPTTATACQTRSAEDAPSHFSPPGTREPVSDSP